MLLLDIILRGSSIGLMGLLAGLLWRAPIEWEGRLSVVAVAVAQSAHLLLTAAMPLEMSVPVTGILTVFSSLTPSAVTWLIVTIFLDPPGKRWPWLVASLFVSLHYYLFQTAPELVAHVPCGTSAVALFGALFGLALVSSRDDLVECRCQARPGFAAAIAALGIVMTASESFNWPGHDAPLMALLASGGTSAIVISFAVWILRPDTSLWPGASSEPSPTAAHIPTQTVDALLIERIKAAMAAGIWQEEGLTIGTLAARLNVPEHRMRKAINAGLGYRNFSSFINQARIAAAKAQLSDPEKAHKTVLELAYGVGFASLGPFNRAFRDVTGQSPTEYRKAMLSAALAHGTLEARNASTRADSENHAPISAKLN
ncbi:AraC family transcriptional regulator [Gymnodinialimonas sp. 57CJ19]|uniref:helix-turn-helix domain-containing protein n=1 Tax=Gymnodinialimonas sp. 57CJ19 TaxID=3138498 RepID=UPI00313438C8